MRQLSRSAVSSALVFLLFPCFVTVAPAAQAPVWLYATAWRSETGVLKTSGGIGKRSYTPSCVALFGPVATKGEGFLLIVDRDADEDTDDQLHFACSYS